jgi:superfamily I DNA/RNA helicase
MNLDDVLATCKNSPKGGVKITTIPGAYHSDEAKTLEELRKLRLFSKEDGEPYRLVFKDHLIWLTKSSTWGWYVNARPERKIPAATLTPKTVKSKPVTTTSSHGGGLSSEQQCVVDHIATTTQGDVLVIAGPGSGKTKTLVSCIERIVREGTPGEKIAVLSFTNNSAAELKVRLCSEAEDLPSLHRVHVSTFHGWVSQLASLRVEPWSHPPIGLQTTSLALALHLRKPDTARHVFTRTEVSAADRHFEGCETFETMEERNFNKIGKKGSREANRLGFDNLVKAAGDLEAKMKECQISTFGSLMKSGIDLAKGLQSGDLRWLFIDEAQDLNSTQADFVDAVQASTGCRIFAIADDDQGIYKFRGASNQFLRDFQAKETTTTFELTENFRSTQAIVGASLGWIRANWERTGASKVPYHSSREGLPVVLLTGFTPELRGSHAKIILEACRSNGLLDAMGEVAALSLSANPESCFDLKDSGLPCSPCTEGILPDSVCEDFLEKCEGSSAVGDWHHTLWREFLEEVKRAQSSPDETRFGHPGLRELYASLEVIRRMAPDMKPEDAAKVLTEFNPKKDFSFYGSKPDPDYTGADINLLSLHSSKGMEFRVVWLIGGDFVIQEKKRDLEQGQPNVLGELGEWGAKALGVLVGAPISADQANRLAAEMENRRLLYVGMSRATDLLLISVPQPKKSKKATTRPDYISELDAALAGVAYVKIHTDAQAHEFARTISSAHRHPTWSPPHRYRVESFTSLTGQAAPGEEREQEIPCDREFPLPQSREAMIGDLFHRIMHLLRLEPDLIAQRLCDAISDDDLIARVSTRIDLEELRDLLGKFFSDTTNEPWGWLGGNALTEVPFSHVMVNGREEILVKGFVDLVRFSDAGEPILLVDYKTGDAPAVDSEEDRKHSAQLLLYAEALSSSYRVKLSSITLLNYYAQSQEIRQRS